MRTRHTHRTPPPVAARRRRPARHLELFAPPTEAPTAAAMDDAEQARQLIADLLALVDGGLITPMTDLTGTPRYAPTTTTSAPQPDHPMTTLREPSAPPTITSLAYPPNGSVPDPFTRGKSTATLLSATTANTITHAARIEQAVNLVGGPPLEDEC